MPSSGTFETGHTLDEILAVLASKDFGAAFARWYPAYGALENGKPVGFGSYEFLREIIAEHHPYTVFEKCAQMAVTVTTVLRSFAAADLLGLNTIYFFPTQAEANGFSGNRAKPMIDNSPHLMQRISDINSVGARRIGNGTVYFRGMKGGMEAEGEQGSTATKSVPADMVVFDELDEASPKSKESALKRLGASDYRWVVELSNPTIPNYGIDVEFQKSDMRYWLVRCEGCNEYTCLEEAWPDNIVEPSDGSAPFVGCVACRRPLDVNRGQWVALRPEVKSRRGYHLCRLMSPKADIADLLACYRDPKKRAAMIRLDLGMPHIEGGDKLEAEAILACQENYEEWHGAPQDTGCSMGVDVGSLLHFQISAPDAGGKRRRVVKIGAVHEFEELDAFMRAFDIRHAVIDAMPETRKAREFANRFPFRVDLCWYAEEGAPRFDSKKHEVHVGRSESLSATQALFDREKPGIILPGWSPNLVEYASHGANVVRKIQENAKTGEQRIVYIRNGPDHWFHAANYDRIAWTGGFAKASVD